MALPSISQRPPTLKTARYTYLQTSSTTLSATRFKRLATPCRSRFSVAVEKAAGTPYMKRRRSNPCGSMAPSNQRLHGAPRGVLIFNPVSGAEEPSARRRRIEELASGAGLAVLETDE